MPRQPHPIAAAASSGREEGASALAAALRRVSDLAELTELVGLGQRLDIPFDAAALTTAAGRAVRSGQSTLDRLLAAVASEENRACVVNGAVAGLTDADEALIDRVATDKFCEQSFDRDWTDAPRVGVKVLTAHGCRHPELRLHVSDALVDLADRNLVPGDDIDHCLIVVWRAPNPTIAECLALFGGQGVLNMQRARRTPIVSLASRAFLAGDIASGEALVLAKRVLGLGTSEETVAADAHGVLAYHRFAVRDLLDGYLALERAFAGTRKIYANALAHGRREFQASQPVKQAELLARLPSEARIRRELADVLLSRRGRLGDHIVVEVAVRLYKAGKPLAALSNRTVKVAREPGEPIMLAQRLAKVDRSLPSYLDRLLAEADRGWLGGIFR